MELHYLDLTEIGRLIAAREVSPVEVTEAILRRIEQVDGVLKSYVHITADLALDQARTVEREIGKGQPRSALHGVPIALKDLFSVKRMKTAAGMPLRRDHVPDKDCTVVQRLRTAGAVFLGSVKMTEGAHAEHRPPVFEAPLNPWNHDLWSGASSSGSGVAAAAGLCFASLGTDTGGSIRLPACVNAVTGLKPTWGRVSRAGVFELAALFDHVGPLARSAADTGVVLSSIAGPDPEDPTASHMPVPDCSAEPASNLSDIRIGVDRDLVYGKSEPQVARSIETALEALASRGARIVEVRLPDIDAVAAIYLPACAVQTALAHAATFPSRQDEYGSALTSLIELGRRLSGMEHHKLMLQVTNFRCSLHALFERADLLALPVLPFPAPTVAQMKDTSDELIQGIVRFTSPFSMSGHPTINMPCGFAENRGPISLQLVGPYFSEPHLIRVGHAFQLATDWHKRRPLP